MAIQASIDELEELGHSLDQLAERLDDGGQGEMVAKLAEGLRQAEERIASLVLEAESCQRLSDQRLVSIKGAWLARFERFFELVERTSRHLDREADLRLSRHRAADSYLKNQTG